VGFESAATMFGLDYTRPTSTEEFLTAYRAARSANSPSLIEVETDRDENVAVHRDLLERVTTAVRGD
jgi:2-succinyl-5-enolpyruvyl-6-hydroxy-3-cyclohexene-1-carboxylate synthase